MKSQIRKGRKIIDRVIKRYQESQKKPIRVGFVGCGRHATTNLYPCLRYAGLDLAAVCARHLENAQNCAWLFGAESAYQDYREMLRKEKIDGLIVCVEQQLHYEVSVVALSEGIPVFVEKPPAPTANLAKEMLDLSNSTGKFLMVGFNKRFAPIYREAKRIIETGEFGRLNSITINANVGATKDAKSLLLEIGIHYLDLLRFFCGEAQVNHVEKRVHGQQVNFIITFTCRNSVIASVQLSNCFGWSKPSEAIHILGKESLLLLEDSQKITYHKATIASPGEIPCETEKSTVWSPNYSIPVKENHLIYLNGYVSELRHFADRVYRKDNGESSIEDGYCALKMIEDILNCPVV